MMRLLHFACLVPLLAVSLPAADAPVPRLLLGQGDRLAAVKARLAAEDSTLRAALRKIRARADEALSAPITNVVRFGDTPPSGDRHDYYSLSPYWWPNPDTPDGLPYIWRDGETNPERYESDVAPLETMANAVSAQGPAWYFTGDERYAVNAAQRLRAWFLDPATRMSPNMTYAQTRKGHGYTSFSGIIEVSRLRWLIDAAILLESSPAWNTEDAAALRRWFGEFAVWLMESPEGIEESMAPNNHGTWHAAHTVLFALYAGREDIARARLEEMPRRIFQQVFMDGRQPQELIRTRSLHYHDFNNRALVDVARLGRVVGVDLFAYRSSDGRSLRLALEYPMPFVLGEKEWPAQQINALSFGSIAETYWRAANGFPDRAFADFVRRLPGGVLPDPIVQLLDPLPEGW